MNEEEFYNKLREIKHELIDIMFWLSKNKPYEKWDSCSTDWLSLIHRQMYYMLDAVGIVNHEIKEQIKNFAIYRQHKKPDLQYKLPHDMRELFKEK